MNTFYREHILLILKIKKLLRKIKSKNLTAGVFFFLVDMTHPHIILSKETCLSEVIPTSYSSLGFTFLRHDRSNGPHGGVLIAVKNDQN